MAATTAGAATAGGCDDDRLKACIVAASESVWGVRDVSSRVAQGEVGGGAAALASLAALGLLLSGMAGC
jgi:hypothetical protein